MDDFESFKSELFRRITGIEQAQAATKAMLEERCVVREKILDNLSGRVFKLEVEEHKRSGARAVWAIIAGIGGGLLTKFFPWGGGQ
ncbi:MAG: hypothetical protein LBQ51_05700 [Desulfovibrio sp.]|jgi:hypothetical protein|nr:hypothetical protein [Desulfovibrio sp.]